MGTDSIDPVALARQLIRRPSVTPEDAGALDVLCAPLHDLGFDCHRLRFEAPGTAPVDNLYARLGADAPNLCFAGHTDVVPVGDRQAWTRDPFGAEVIDDVLHGRGAVDMKGAIACFVAAVAGFVAERGAGFGGSISLLITGDEEGAAVNGTVKVLDWLSQRGERLDACLVGEPTNPTRLGEMIKIGRRGSMTGRLTVRGVQGHTAYPDRADNPCHRLVRLLTSVTAEALDDGTEHFQPSGLQIVSIDVGNPVDNVIPAQATARFNIRFNDRHSSAGLERWLRSRFDGADRLRRTLRVGDPGERGIVPGAAGAAERPHCRRRRGGAGPAPGARHRRRHLRRPLHQGRLSGGRVRPGRPDHAPGGRADADRRPSAALTRIYRAVLDRYFVA